MNKNHASSKGKEQLWCSGTEGPLWFASTDHFAEMETITTFQARGRDSWCLFFWLLRLLRSWTSEIGISTEISCWEPGVSQRGYLPTRKRCHTILTTCQNTLQKRHENRDKDRSYVFAPTVKLCTLLTLYSNTELIWGPPHDVLGEVWLLDFFSSFSSEWDHWINLFSQLFTISCLLNWCIEEAAEPSILDLPGHGVWPHSSGNTLNWVAKTNATEFKARMENSQ